MMEDTPVLNQHNKDEFEPMHTAEHIVNQTMGRLFGCARSKDAHIERKKSKINFMIDRPVTEIEVKKIEDTVNEIIKQDLPVTYEFVTRDNVPDDVTLDKLPEDASETLRLVRIGNYDVCACIGKHVEHTAQLGEFKINSTSYNEGKFRIVFKLINPDSKYL
jgi:Ser-tRNA(Ala) deacylase AlaX